MRSRVVRYLVPLFVLGLTVVWASVNLAAQAVPHSLAAAVRAMEKDAGGPLSVTVSAVTGTPSFLRTAPGSAVPLNVAASAPPDERARAFLQSYGQALGLPAPGQVTVLAVSGRDEIGMDHVRLQQVHQGIPVRGAQLTVHLRGASVVAVHAKGLPGVEGIHIAPSVTASDALAVAASAVAEHFGVADAELSAPRLEIFNRGLIEGSRTPTRLAWFVEGRGRLLRAYVWVDAHTAQVLFHLNQLPEALDRRIHDPDPVSPHLPGPLRRAEGEPPTGDADVDDVYDYSGDTYAYFFAAHGRDSWDGAGATMIAVANYPLSTTSFWMGDHIVMADFIVADDIVAHEWTHGVTQTTADLIYYMQSGALNESYSDIFGETVDLTNGAGNDGPLVRWALFERFLGANGYRNMRDPNIGFIPGPGRMSDAGFFACGTEDAGGVHTNSGIGNHAFALMVDGGTYNNHTIVGIGLTKAAKIQYRALSLYLTQSSSYQDNYDALQQACDDLIGTDGITAADCEAMEKALEAVEMSDPWPCTCGNGLPDGGEECDDGNAVDGDGCDSNCTLTACGNGIVTVSEQCDGGDCCLPTCQLEPSGTVCADDGDVCTDHQCDGAGTCQLLYTSAPCYDGMCVEGVCTGGSIDHFKCYKAKDLKNPKFVPTTVDLTDQFGVNDGQFEVKKPFLMCNPADKNAEGITDPGDHLTCYKIKGPKLETIDRPQVRVMDQFGSLDLEAKKPFLLCVPSAKTVLP